MIVGFLLLVMVVVVSVCLFCCCFGFCLFLCVYVCVYYGGGGCKMMSSHLLPTCQVCQIGFTGVGFTPREQ